MGSTTITGSARTYGSSNPAVAWPLGYAGKQWKSFIAQASACMHPIGASAVSRLHARSWERKGQSPPVALA